MDPTASSSAAQQSQASSSTDSAHSRSTITTSYPVYQSSAKQRTTHSDAASSATPSSSAQPFPSGVVAGSAQDGADAPAASSHARTSSIVGRKPLSLESQSVVGAGSPVTPRRGKRMSLGYISSPSLGSAGRQQTGSPSLSTPGAEEGSFFSQRSGSNSRSGSIRRSSNAAATASASTPYAQANAAGSHAAQGTTSGNGTTDGEDDWLMSDNEASGAASTSRPPTTPAKSMGERDSAKIESQFHDSGYREGITAGKLSTLQGGFDHGFNEARATPQSKRASSSYSATGSSASESARKTEDGDTMINAHRNLLTSIAEKERRCFELREELRLEEEELKRLQTAWQSTISREMAYPSGASSATSPTAHRRSMSSSTFSERSFRASHSRGESNDSLPQAAAEAWNSLSSKLPGSFKNGLSNLLEQMAVGPNERKSSDGQLVSPLSPSHDAATPSSLKPPGSHLTIGSGRSLSVLEEEMSDNGSATPAALSPRSPHPPAQLLAHPDSEAEPRAEESWRQRSRDSTNTPPMSQREFDTADSDEIGPPTPPKTNSSVSTTPARGGLWSSKRNSVFGSLSNLQKQVFQSPSSPSSPKFGSDERRFRSRGGGGDDSGSRSPSLSSSSSGWGLGGSWAKKLREARENASDMLREAERKLGNAMTIDDLLGLPPSSSGSSLGSNGGERDSVDHISSSSPSLSGRERDASDASNLLWRRMQASEQQHNGDRGAAVGSRPEDSPWFAAAGGTVRTHSPRRNSTTAFTPSPHLSPSMDPRRLSTTSMQSASSLTSESGRRRSISPKSPLAFQDGASPPAALGVMGSGILGLISQAWSPEEERPRGGADDGYLNVSGAARRKSGDGTTLSPRAAAEKRTSMLSEIGDRMGATAASPSLSAGNAWEWGSDGWGDATSPNPHTPSPQLGGGIRLSLIDVDEQHGGSPQLPLQPTQHTPPSRLGERVDSLNATPRLDRKHDWI